MHAAFRSQNTAIAFCLLIIVLLSLPFLVSFAGLPPREAVYESIPVRFGVPGHEVEAIYRDPQNSDIVFLGSSLVMTAIVPRPLEQSLSSHIGRPAHVTVLGMVWQGLDLQYFILRDFLQYHHPQLIVLNEPGPRQAPNEPHPEAYRWVRFGEFRGDFTGLPLRDKIQIYSHMVLGCPRQILSRIRPDLIAPDETSLDSYDNYLKTVRLSGHNGAPFVTVKDFPSPGQRARLLPLDSPLIASASGPPASYQLHFLQKILELAKNNHCKLVFLHIPSDDEYNSGTIPEFAPPPQYGTAGYQIIGVPSKTLYAGLTKEKFLDYYSDAHMNMNGSKLFTAAITPALIEAYDESRTNF